MKKYVLQITLMVFGLVGFGLMMNHNTVKFNGLKADHMALVETFIKYTDKQLALDTQQLETDGDFNSVLLDIDDRLQQVEETGVNTLKWIELRSIRGEIDLNEECIPGTFVSLNPEQNTGMSIRIRICNGKDGGLIFRSPADKPIPEDVRGWQPPLN
jgi:hypothetical protein